MAQRRMFNKVITNSDNFLDMPLSAQCLYFHLSMNADDDGFVNSPKTTLRMIGADLDDYKILISNNFIIEFESGVIVIKHWRLNNYLQKDRFTPTAFKSEKALLELDDNNVYTLDTKCIQSVYIDKISIDKKSKDKISKDKNILCVSNKSNLSNLSNPSNPLKNIDAEIFVDIYNEYCTDMPKIKDLSDKRKKGIMIFLKKYSKDDFKTICNLANRSDFLSGRNGKWTSCNFDWLININNALKVLEGNYNNKSKNEIDILKELYEQAKENELND